MTGGVEQDLTQAIRELNAATISLRTLIEREYPTRKEMEERYVRKEASRRRIAVAAATTVISTLLCFVGTVSTVSTCFLGDDDHPSACSLMPGYSETQAKQKELEQIISDLREDKRRKAGQ